MRGKSAESRAIGGVVGVGGGVVRVQMVDLGVGSLAVYLNGVRLGLMVAEGIAAPVRWAVGLSRYESYREASARLETQPHS